MLFKKMMLLAILSKINDNINIFKKFNDLIYDLFKKYIADIDILMIS